MSVERKTSRTETQQRPVTFLGAGRITSAILAGLQLVRHNYQLTVHDRHGEKLRRLKKQHGIVVDADLERSIADCEMLVVAVQPAFIPEILQRLQLGHGKSTTTGLVDARLAISLAAGVPLRTLTRLCPRFRWVRAMPSPVGRFGRGLTALTFPRDLPSHDRKRAHNLFALIGSVVEIPEATFDAFTVTYSSSHGYHALAALAEVAEEAGLDREIALLAAAHALADGISAWREGHLSLKKLTQEAVTPGGIAAATTAAMDEAGYKKSIRSGIDAGLRRARANAG